MPAFYDWVIQNYIESDTPEGDLARDMSIDRDCPKSYSGTRRRIILSGGCSGAVEAVDNLWKQYKQKYPTEHERATAEFCGFTISHRLSRRFYFNKIKTIEDVMNLDLEVVSRWQLVGPALLSEINDLRAAIKEKGGK